MKTKQNLLSVYQKDIKAPPALKIPVNPELSPFLVSSSTSLVWTERIENNEVWTVSRDLGENIQADILAAVVEKSLMESWGNVFSLNERGVQESLDYLHRCGYTEIDVLVNPQTGLESIDEKGVSVVFTTWTPVGCVVLVPTIREFVGNLILFQNQMSCVCVHNSKFGMAIAVEVE